MSSWVGKNLKLHFTGVIRCVDCGRPTKKSFGGGSCFPCFQSLAKNDQCILKPELCHFHKGTCREPEWGQKNCFKDHILYFANSSGIKVGITKANPISNRWVDQGAKQGIPVLRTSTRRDAGFLEVYFSQFLPDKTAWQKLITQDPESLDLAREREKFLSLLAREKDNLPKRIGGESILFSPLQEGILELNYPILSYPTKAKSLKASEAIEGKLLGIKGQYLLFPQGGINLRSHSGYGFQLKVE